jgi:hypothetical protein
VEETVYPPFKDASGIVNKWIEVPNYLTGCISCNKCMRDRESLQLAPMLMVGEVFKK